MLGEALPRPRSLLGAAQEIGDPQFRTEVRLGVVFQ